jgi:hypothetical protein
VLLRAKTAKFSRIFHNCGLQAIQVSQVESRRGKDLFDNKCSSDNTFLRYSGFIIKHRSFSRFQAAHEEYRNVTDALHIINARSSKQKLHSRDALYATFTRKSYFVVLLEMGLGWLK